MKAMYRSPQLTKACTTLQQREDAMVEERIDSKLRDINRSFGLNFKLQEIFIEVMKSKRMLHSSEIKSFYGVFTENKAESLIFSHTLDRPNPHLLCSDPRNNQAITDTKRLHCRLIEKIMVKISYYLMHSRTLTFLHSQIEQIIKQCETVMNRLKQMRDAEMIDTIVENVYKQNQEIQQKIIDQLINKGYLISADEFYRVNGVDTEHKEYFQRKQECNKQKTQQSQPTQQAQSIDDEMLDEALGLLGRFQINLTRHAPSRMLKVESKHHLHQNMMHRDGIISIENKYRDLLVGIQEIIVKENGGEGGEEVGSLGVSVHKEKMQLQEKGRQTPTHRRTQPKLVSSPLKNSKLNSTAFDQLQHLNRQFFNPRPPQRSLQNEDAIQQTQTPMNSSRYLQLQRQSPQSKRISTPPLFSKNFIEAIKAIDKMNVKDMNSRVGLRRMSSQLIVFNKQETDHVSEHISDSRGSPGRGYTRMFTNSNAISRHNRGNNSIMKLLNIYKNRKEDELARSIKQEVMTVKGNDSFSKKNRLTCKPSQFYKNSNHTSTPENLSHESHQHQPQQHQLEPVLSSKRLSANTNKIIARYSSKALLDKLKQLPGLQINRSGGTGACTPQIMECFRHLENMQAKVMERVQRWTEGQASFGSPSPRNTHNPYRMAQNSLSPLKDATNAALSSTSLFTCQGIDRAPLSNSLVLTRRQFPRPDRSQPSPVVDNCQGRRFEVYDRKRRLILR